MKKGIIFDLDGTLWDSSEQVVEAWNEVLLRYPDLNRQITAADMQSYMGKTMYDIAAMMLPDTDVSLRNKIMDECCENEHIYLEKHNGTLYPHLEAALKKLKQMGYQLYIVSNCQDGYIQLFLRVNKLEAYFDDIECQGRTGRPKSDNIALVVQRNALDRAFYVGDTLLDMQSADGAGVPFIHAAYGFGKPDRDTYRISSIAELTELMDKI
ncbi:MAG: HAD family hydrolase [Oscillospiraceae bacterium]|nr:HAD family hydrolase [Oscillospiraceae bacterium]